MGYRLLKLAPELLVDLLSQDGTQLFKMEGMPDDAKLVDVFMDSRANLVMAKVRSSAWTTLPGQFLDTMEVIVSRVKLFESTPN